jgi:metal-responsive CopG/Arc/MetJ family transcriptional regulator
MVFRMRIYADLDDGMLTRLDNYMNKKPYSMRRNQAIIELLDKALREAEK